LNEFKIVETSTLTHSLGGLEVPLLTITNFTKPELVKKKVVFIMGRVHPGETNASWILQGILEFLLGCDKLAVELRKRFEFKVVPMLNPDGVVLGNNRTSLAGKDLNRAYINPNSKLTPVNYHIR